MASARTKPASAAYWAAADCAVWAARVAIQLTTTKPPSTHSHEPESITRAMGRARPDAKRAISMNVKPRMAPSRCRYVRVMNEARASTPSASAGSARLRSVG
jgi:hypothetical protein